MLKQRILTAVVLLAVLLPALFAPRPDYFVGVTLLAVLAACWEWARLLHTPAVALAAFPIVVGLAGAVLWWQGLASPVALPLLLAACVSWAVMLPLSLPRAAVPRALTAGAGKVLHLAFAGLAALTAWLSLALARQQGAWFVLSLLLLVWIADTAAYFVGRKWGRHKLALHISPGKTWEGAVAGLLAAGVYGAGCTLLAGSYFLAVAGPHWPVAALLAMVLAAVSICGDLFESVLKRQAGVKDSSALLPGHGGFLDRLDALLPTLPLALLIYDVWA